MLPKSEAGCLRSRSECTRKLYIKLCVVVHKVCGWQNMQMFFLTKHMNTLAKDFLKSSVLLQ